MRRVTIKLQCDHEKELKEEAKEKKIPQNDLMVQILKKIAQTKKRKEKP